MVLQPRNLPFVTLAALALLGPVACSSGSSDGDGDSTNDIVGATGNHGESNPVPGYDLLGGTWQMVACNVEWDSRVYSDSGDDFDQLQTAGCESVDNAVTFKVDGSYEMSGYVGLYNTSSGRSGEIFTSNSQYDFPQLTGDAALRWFVDDTFFHFGVSDSLFLSTFTGSRCDQPEQTLHVYDNDVTQYYRMTLFSVDSSAFTVRTAHTMCRIGVDANLDSETDVTASFTFERLD